MPSSTSVFVLGSTPSVTYVNRSFKDRRTGERLDPEAEISRVMRSAGIILQVVGPSKSGKTVAIERIFSRPRRQDKSLQSLRTVESTHLVKVSGSEIRDPDRLWLLVCKALGISVTWKDSSSTSRADTSETEASAGGSIYAAEFGVKKASGVERTQERSTEVERQGDPLRLGVNGLVLKDALLFLDDFHAIPASQRPIVASQLKFAAESGAKICLAEVPHKADEPIKGMPDLTGRISKVEFSYWTTEDLEEIANKGFLALGMRVSPSIVSALALESCGSPQLMQVLCLELTNRFGVTDTLDPPQSVAVNLRELSIICIRALAKVEREAVVLAIERGLSRNQVSSAAVTVAGLGHTNLGTAVLAALALDPPTSKLNVDVGRGSVLERTLQLVSVDSATRPENIAAIVSLIQELGEQANPSLPPIDVDGVGRVNILDPYFYFYLRWHEKFYSVREAQQSRP